MPLYEYDCPTCGRFERIQKFADAPLSTCPTCESAVQKLLSAPAFQFKGSGWYITDYARKASGGEGKSDGVKSDKGDGGGTKPEAAKAASDSTASGGAPTTGASPPAAK